MYRSLILALCLVGCASRPEVSITYSYSTPAEPPLHSEPELTVQDYRTVVHHELPVVDEAIEYENSIRRIEKEIRDEYLRLEMYREVYGEKSGEYLWEKKEICAVDMILDSRSGHHMKPYCQDQQ